MDETIRVMTYNVHGCVGSDFRRSESRIAQVLAKFLPDIVGLQELDVGRTRSRQVDQAAVIAQEVGFHSIFHPIMRYRDEQYGNAILSRFPIRTVKIGELPTYLTFPFPEKRGAIWVETESPKLQIITTHFGVGLRERVAQSEALANSEWLASIPDSAPCVLMGDFNSTPRSKPYENLSQRLDDARVRLALPAQRTFPSLLCATAIDHIFVSRRFEVLRYFAAKTMLTRTASDHLPLIADLRILKDEETDEAGASRRSLHPPPPPRVTR